jgi:hypothetical protein
LIKALLWVVRKLLLIGPSAVIAVWGYNYLQLCVNYLLAPGKPVEVRYKAKAGAVLIHADSYAVDLRLHCAFIKGLRIEAPSGGVVAHSKLVDISNWDLKRGLTQSPIIDIYELSGSLVRFKNGQFELAGLLPPQQKSTSKAPYLIRVHRASILLVDLKGRPWQQFVSSNSVTISGSGPNWLAFGQAQLPGMGSAVATVQNASGVGVQINGSTNSMDGTKFLSHILTDSTLHFLDKIRNLRVGHVVASGPIEVFVPANLRFRFQTKAVVAAKDLNFQGYHLDKATFAGIVGLGGAVGKCQASLGTNVVDLDGSVSFKGKLSAGAHVVARCQDIASLPKFLARYVPPGLTFSGAKFEGWSNWSEEQGPVAQGTATVSRITYRAETATDSKVSVFVNRDQVRTDLENVILAGSKPLGSMQVDLRNKTMVAYGLGDNLSLPVIGRLTHSPGAVGAGSIHAIATGPLSAPTISFLSQAEGSYQTGKYKFGPDKLQVYGSYKKNQIRVARGYLEGKDGLFTISGNGSAAGQKLNLDVEARNVHPGRYVSGLEGVVSLSAKVSGDYKNPRAAGEVRAVDLNYKDQHVPAAVAHFVADRNHIEATHIGAISGTVDLDGSGGLNLNSSALHGSLSMTGLELAQYLGGNVAGLVDIPTISLSGSVKHPKVVARLLGTNLICGDILVDGIEALVSVTPENAVVDHATANFAGGSVSATGSYDLKTKTGSGVATSTALDLGKIVPALGESITVSGFATLTEAKVAYKDGQVSGTATGKIDNIVANGAAAGDGNWALASNGHIVSGNVSIGEVLPELRVIDLDGSYNIDDKTISGTFDSDRSPLREIVAASLRYLPATLAANRTALIAASGDVTIGAKVAGPVATPDISIGTFQINNLAYKGQPFGNLIASNISRTKRTWSIPQLTLSGPEGSISASGTVAEQGRIQAAIASVKDANLKASAFGVFVPALVTSKADAKFSATLSGDTSAPDLNATVKLNHVASAPSSSDGAKPDRDLTITLDKIGIAKGTIGIGGAYGYDGFTGSFDGTAPFSYAGGFGEGSIQAHLVLDKRELKDLPFITEFVDPARSQGTLSGELSATGPMSNLTLDGGFDFSAETLGFRFSDPNAYIKRVDDELKNVQVKLSVSGGHTLILSANGTEVRGGDISLTSNMDLPDLGSISNKDSSTIMGQFLDSPLSGRLAAKNLTFKQSAPGGYVAGVIDGETTFGGTFKNPAIGTRDKPGAFTLSHVESTLPTFPSKGSASAPSNFNPEFNLTAILKDPAHIKSSTADLLLNGNSSLKGSLTEPQAKADFVVASGTVRLPGGTVRLTQGGTVDLNYINSFGQESTAAIDVDLEGKTSITAIRYGQTTQRYDITVDITGNLLQQNGIRFDAISDPPDLSSDDVLALLGQKNLLESLGSGDPNADEQRIRDALVGFALPSVLDPYTSSLAHNLSLDYISLEYNAVNLATVDFAKSISPDFTLQYRQQVGTPPPGYRSIYDFRLVYSPRKGPKLFRRLSLSAGTDQDRPWKIALEYGVRFGGYAGPPPP